ncbi:MAG: hypothetical protein ACHQII_02055, partial [Bacteroidia bacterium]
MKKNAGILLSLVSILVLGFSCTKNSNSVSGGGSTNNNNQTTNTSSYYGILSVFAQQNVTNGTLTPIPLAPYGQAFFSSVATNTLNTSTYTKVNNVSLNGTFYKFYSYQYQDSTGNIASAPYMWVVSGLGAIPSFTYTNNNAFPALAGYSLLPDTIDRSQQTIIPMNGLSNSDTTRVIITDCLMHAVKLSLASNATSVSFPAFTLSALSASNNPNNTSGFSGYITIRCTKNNVQTFGGKYFNFPLYYQLV